jgi:nucleotide-binding universal stress UspA family protein
MSQTVVVALDSSVLSSRALPFARTAADLWHGRVILVHATKHSGRPGSCSVDGRLTEVVRALRSEGIAAEAQLRSAPPAQAIVDIARAEHADLIVMASHQRHGVDRWLHGSVTEEVLENTLTPLLVVPAQAVPPDQRTRRILVPLDGSLSGEAAVDFLSGLSSKRPLDVLFLRIVPVGPVVVGWGAGVVVPSLDAAEMEAEVRVAEAYLAQRADDLSAAGVRVRRQVIETAEPIARVILESAEREQVDIIAIGTHGKGDMARLVLGSVSEDVLEHSLVPVLLVRPRAAAAAAGGSRENAAEFATKQ